MTRFLRSKLGVDAIFSEKAEEITHRIAEAARVPPRAYSLKLKGNQQFCLFDLTSDFT